MLRNDGVGAVLVVRYFSNRYTNTWVTVNRTMKPEWSRLSHWPRGMDREAEEENIIRPTCDVDESEDDDDDDWTMMDLSINSPGSELLTAVTKAESSNTDESPHYVQTEESAILWGGHITNRPPLTKSAPAVPTPDLFLLRGHKEKLWRSGGKTREPWGHPAHPLHHLPPSFFAPKAALTQNWWCLSKQKGTAPRKGRRQVGCSPCSDKRRAVQRWCSTMGWFQRRRWGELRPQRKHLSVKGFFVKTEAAGPEN